MKRPDAVTVSQLFSASARYKAPVFQRYYKWGRVQFEQLVDDIDQADPTIGQFLGAIVLKDMGRESGPTSPSIYLLIDGQQRLTTLYLVLLALASVAEEHSQDADVDYIWNNYLVETSTRTYHGWPKLVPTLQDRHTFGEVLTSALPKASWEFSADPEDKKPRVSHVLANQWNRIRGHVAKSVVDASGTFDRALFDGMLTSVQAHLHLINITLEAADDANAIFSRLNSRGVPLELADLIRNEVFSKFGATDAEKAEKFFQKEWQPFEKGIPAGHLSQFFPVYAYIVLKGKVTKAAAFGALQRKWKSEKPATILSDLKKYSPLFSSLSVYRPIRGLSKELNGQVERFSRMPRSRVTWPFIVETLRAVEDGRLSELLARRSLEIVEAFLVRRALTGTEPTGLHAVFKVLWEKSKGDPATVLRNIVTRTIKSPNNAELISFLERERSDSRVVLRFVMEENEREFIKANKFDPAPETAVTIEHILPQTLSVDWERTCSKGMHKECVGLIGNLVPLSEQQNKSVQDDVWKEKRKRYRGSNFKITREVAKSGTWVETDIRSRTTELAHWIVRRWPELASI